MAARQSVLLTCVLLCGHVVAPAQSPKTHFSGEVASGNEYKHEMGSGLSFILTPDETGWMISVVPKTHCAENDNWAAVVNGPFRNYNALYVDSAYGNTAQDAVKGFNPRVVSFVLTCADYKTEGHRLEMVLWPYSYPKKDAAEALAKLGSSPAGKATFTILDSRTSPAGRDVEGKNFGKIDWLKFRVDVNFPAKIK